MKFDINKYKFYTFNNQVVAVSTYGGRTVKGVAKCDPKDEFDLESGKKLAAARCQKKVSDKRLKRALKKREAAFQSVQEAVEFYNKMVDYVADAATDVQQADEELDKLLTEL